MKIDKNRFLELYRLGYSRKKLAKYFNVTEHKIRKFASQLQLRLGKEYREIDYLKYLQRKEGKDFEIAIENEILEKEYYKLNLQLQNCKDKNSLLQKQLKQSLKLENIYHLIKEQIQNLRIKPLLYKENLPLPQKNATKSIICFSDLHIGALVEKEDVAFQNEYNFEIAKNRIDKVFMEFLASPYRSKDIVIVLLGDIFDGIIHNSHLIAEKPVAEAIVEFSRYFAEWINSLNNYNIEIKVVTGNHERITDDMQFHKKGMDFTYLFVEFLKSLTQKDIEYFVHGYGLFQIKDDYTFMFHGDIDRQYKSFNEQMQLKAITNCKNIYGVEPKLLLSGHIHQYSKSMLYNGGYAITVGSLMGSNSYAYNSGYLNFIPSQVILYYRDDNLISEEVVVFKNEN